MNAPGSTRAANLEYATPLGAYEVILSSQVRRQVDGAPPILLGYLNGITAILRIDPMAASTILHIRPAEDNAWTAAFASGRGFVTYWVLETQRRVILLDWIWAG
jgi:hypothetical protein